MKEGSKEIFMGLVVSLVIPLAETQSQPPYLQGKLGNYTLDMCKDDEKTVAFGTSYLSQPHPCTR